MDHMVHSDNRFSSWMSYILDMFVSLVIFNVVL